MTCTLTEGSYQHRKKRGRRKGTDSISIRAIPVIPAWIRQAADTVAPPNISLSECDSAKSNVPEVKVPDDERNDDGNQDPPDHGAPFDDAGDDALGGREGR